MPAFIEAARLFQIEPVTFQVSSKAEIESSLAQLSDKPGAELIVMPDNFMSLNREVLVTVAARFRIPAIYPYRYFVELGGLLSYGIDAPDLFRRAAEYISRILRGENPQSFLFKGQRNFNSRSILGPPRVSDSPCRISYSQAPIT